MATNTKKDDQTEQVTTPPPSDTPITAAAAEETGLTFVEDDVVREYFATGHLPVGKRIQLRYVDGESRWIYVE